MAGSGRRRLQDGGRHVVVVESPAKARTIGAWLGSSYRVMATRGHVRDLPARAGSVDPGDGFSMVYETGKRAARTLGAIAKALARADILVLATDPDREGEAIAWQVLSWLAERNAVGERPVLRVVFHEVTPTAVRRALIRPRAIDMDLVRAWQARRALDYLVGYGLSPVLWRKLPGCRSAGRVQSVALRLAGGDLVLKIECAGTVVQIRVRGSAPFPEDGGIDIRHRFAMRMPPTMGRMVDFWTLAGLPAPRRGRDRGARTGLS